MPSLWWWIAVSKSSDRYVGLVSLFYIIHISYFIYLDIEDLITLLPESETQKIEIFSTTERCPLKPTVIYHEVGIIPINKIIAEVETTSAGAVGSQESFMVNLETSSFFHL